jgi:hypothetical protein
MGKLINAAKQFKEVVGLREENLELYNEKQYLEVELEERNKEYDIANKRCQQYYKLFNEIKNVVNQNQNGSVLNLQNKIKTLLKEAKI